ncbi:MAG: hypothetical protein ACRC1H_02225, partial [Caldilineaceae bacterium]
MSVVDLGGKQPFGLIETNEHFGSKGGLANAKGQYMSCSEGSCCVTFSCRAKGASALTPKTGLQ